MTDATRPATPCTGCKALDLTHRLGVNEERARIVADLRYGAAHAEAIGEASPIEVIRTVLLRAAARYESGEHLEPNPMPDTTASHMATTCRHLPADYWPILTDAVLPFEYLDETGAVQPGVLLGSVLAPPPASYMPLFARLRNGEVISRSIMRERVLLDLNNPQVRDHVIRCCLALDTDTRHTKSYWLNLRDEPDELLHVANELYRVVLASRSR